MPPRAEMVLDPEFVEHHRDDDVYIDAGSLDRLAREVSSFIKVLEFGADQRRNQVMHGDEGDA